MIYFTSDTHFYHNNIIKYEDRPFANIREMNSILISNWNQKVLNSDDVYILGDFAFTDGRTANELLKSLNGRKYLIKGNHDSFLKDKDFDYKLFQWIKDYYVLKDNNQKFVLFHYPIQVWDCKHHGAIHLYGHIHSDKENHHPMVAELQNAFNVGVDVNYFTPVSIESIKTRSMK